MTETKQPDTKAPVQHGGTQSARSEPEKGADAPDKSKSEPEKGSNEHDKEPKDEHKHAQKDGDKEETEPKHKISTDKDLKNLDEQLQEAGTSLVQLLKDVARASLGIRLH